MSAKTTGATALRSLGYRRMRGPEQVWGKPVGYSLFMVEVAGNTYKFTQWFKSAESTGKPLVWDSKKLVIDDKSDAPLTQYSQVLYWLKGVENYTKNGFETQAEFEFLSSGDLIG